MEDFKINVLDVAPINFSEFLAQQESQNRLNGGDYTTIVSNSVTVLEDKGDIDITLKVTNKEGKAIGFSDKMIAGNDIIYTAEIKAKPGKTVTAEDLEKYKKNLKWLVWVGGKAPTESGVRKIMSGTSKNDTTTSFMKNDVVTKNNIDKAYYYSRIATTEEGKAYKTKLTVKWSKWLELAQDKEGKKRIRVEAYINKPKKTSASNNGVASRLIQANPEIIEAYWKNAEGKRIIETGYTQDIYLHLKTLGLLDQDLEVNVYDKDYYPTPNQPTIFYGRTAKDDLITWKNNTITIEGNNALKQFKVGNKIRYKNATADEDNDYKCWYDDAISKGDFFTEIDSTEKNNEDLELYIHFPNWRTIKLPADNEYAKLILTTKERIADAFFTEIEKEEVQADAPKNPKTKVSHYTKINKGVLGQKVKLVAACANLEGKKVAFRVFEKTPVLVGEGEPLHLIYKGAPVCLIEAEVKEGYAVAEVELKHCEEQKDNKDWLDELKNGFFDTKGKTANLFIRVTCKGNIVHKKEFLKDSCYKMIGNNWHEPVDDPQIAIYTQYGADNTNKNTYGTARGYTHAGLDIFSLENSNTYACLDAEVFKIQKWTRTTGESGYGHNVTLKVKNPQEVRNRRREYTLAYPTDKKQGASFNPDSDTYLLRYAHLEDVLVKEGQKVKAGDPIGKTGISGVIAGTKDPHLHFNMYSDKKKNPYLVNPAYYVYWKEIGDLTEVDKKTQKDRMEEGIKINAAPTLSKNK